MNDRSQQVQSYFHRSAEEFDRLYHQTSYINYYLTRLFRKGLFERAEISIQECLRCGAESVLDVGSGSGINAILLAENGVNTVLGIDYAQGMIELAKNKLRAELASRVSYKHADFLTWDAMDEKFDCVIALGVFDYIDQPNEFFQKMVKLANKKVMFSAPGKGGIRALQRKIRYRLKKCPLYFYSYNELEELLGVYCKPYRIIPIASGGYFVVLTLVD